MYTIFISNSDDEIKHTLKELCASMEHINIPDGDVSSEHSEIPYCRINTPKAIYNIPHKEILFVESGQKKSIIHLANRAISLPVPLSRIREVLPEPYFVQTLRSFIINLGNASYIDKTKEPWVISFFGSNKTAFISRSFKKDVMQIIRPMLDCATDEKDSVD